MSTNISKPSRKLLLGIIDAAFDHRSWHGANLLTAVRGVRAVDAAKSFAGRKSIWQQVLHAAYWKHRVINRLAGATPFGRKGSNWPRVAIPPNDAAWRADIEFLCDEHRRLREAIVNIPAKKLNAKLVWMIHGAAAHDVYHAGQIKLLRRLIGGRKAR